MPQGKRVLLIDDHRDTLNVMCLLLENSGFQVMAYDHCKPAEIHLQTCDVDIALLDVRLPDRCGDDFGKELRANCPKTMFVFVTGEAHIEPLKDAIPDCFVLRKPLNVDVLFELLERFRSDAGYGSSMPEGTEDRAGPGTM